MYVVFQGYMVDTGFGFKAPLGHAGVVAIDDATGKARYFDFGRYIDPATGKLAPYGLVRDFNLDTVILFDKDKMPTLESSDALNAELSAKFGQNIFPSNLYNANANADKIIEHALKVKSNPSQYPYTINPVSKNKFNTCYNFAWAAFQAGLVTGSH